MTEDRYRSYAALASHEVEGRDYAVRVVARPSHIAVFAPHGGWIEPVTSRVAAAIAGENHSLYCFEGIGPPRSHRDLHIASHRFDEPRALALASRSRVVVTVHGYLEDDAEPSILLGGLDAELVGELLSAFRGMDLPVEAVVHRFPATNLRNICNRGSRGRGVQLELPRSLRDRLAADEGLLHRFAGAVRRTAEAVAVAVATRP